ncbi:uncharacterized protein LOC128192970 [Crassostrea angulata]|uniref:uncharacterized protein LOC128192970 n=1 Tax=Magallana angulata TaxID=2784310 RepID=UPI0022B18259|nr:uncharacterized protein LOC128192970 [Crassostrea angulata]
MDDNFRKANWAEESISILVDLVTDPERWAVIRGKFSPSLTVQKKQRVWEEIAERVNATCSSACVRTVKDVKKKWQDIQSHTKKKEANRKSELRKTGGGPSPQGLKCWEEKIVSILSNDIISGVEGVFDSLDTASLPTDTQPRKALPVSKRRYDDVEIEPQVGMEAPLSSGFCMSGKASRRLSSNEEEDLQSTMVCESIPTTASISLQQRIVQIEEEKLEVMRCNLQVEKRKLELLEQYVHWRMESRADSTPSVSPVIRGLFTS